MLAVQFHQHMRRHCLTAVALLCVSCLVGADQTDPFVKGQNLLALSVSTEQQARDALLDGNRIRKSILQLRQQMAKKSAHGVNAELQINLDESIATSRAAQERGQELRRKASEIRAQAEGLLKQGMINRYSQWIESVGPLLLREQAQIVQTAHNTPVRSTNKKGPEPEPAQKTKMHHDMSLSLSEMPVQQVPPGLNKSSFTISRERGFIGHIELDAESQEAGINELHRWRLVISSLDGTPYEGGSVNFSGHMPGHVHGLPTQPRVTAQIAPGVYQVEGVKFQMRGWWVIDFDISVNEKTTDTLRFNLQL